MSRYTDDLSNKEWEIIKGMFPKQKTGRAVTHELRKMLNAVFYIVRTGCSWRNLPKDFPNWQAVYTRFRRWKTTRLLDKIYKLLTYRLRKLLNKEESSVGIIDSQSVKITDRGGEHGYDGVKKVNGRKRHIVVDMALLTKKFKSFKNSKSNKTDKAYIKLVKSSCDTFILL